MIKTKSFVHNIWKGWLVVAHRIGTFQSKLLLSILYILLVPYGIFFSFFQTDFKNAKTNKSNWKKRAAQLDKLSLMIEQYST